MLLVFVFATAGLGCSSGTEEPGPLLPSDSQTFCVTPSTSPQDVALPLVGGVSGTLSFGPFPAGATGCYGVKFATGGSIAARSHSPTLPFALSSGSTRPLLTVSVGEAFGANPVFGQTSVVTGMTFKSDALNFPDGDYYMSITKATSEGTRVQTIKLTAMNGVLTVAPLRTEGIFGTDGKNAQFPQLVLANTTAILTLYPRGVLPPDPSETETNTPRTKDVSEADLPPLPTDPPPMSTTLPGAKGLPPPVAGTLIGYSRSYWPAPECSGNPGCDSVRPIESNGGSITPIDGVEGMTGTVSFSLNIAYMLIAAIDIDCPSDWDVTVGFNGSGIISIPPSHPFTDAICVINFSTVRAGEGSGYGFTIGLRGLDIGAH
jgi:hypothetical protein